MLIKLPFHTDCLFLAIEKPTQTPGEKTSRFYIFQPSHFNLWHSISTIIIMVASSTASNLEREDHKRDAAFAKAMHGKSSKAAPGIAAMFSKGSEAKKLAVDEYFKHWDNQAAKDETPEQRAVR
jgi:hypothetical protein